MIVENCQNGTIWKQYRDDVKHLPRTVSNKRNNENNPINDKNRHCQCICDCEDFSEQSSKKYNGFSSPFFFQDRVITFSANEKTEAVHDMELIASSLENLQIKSVNAPLRQSAKERKLNARYFNKETITN